MPYPHHLVTQPSPHSQSLFSFLLQVQDPTFSQIKKAVWRMISVGSARLLFTAFVFETAVELRELPPL